MKTMGVAVLLFVLMGLPYAEAVTFTVRVDDASAKTTLKEACASFGAFSLTDADCQARIQEELVNTVRLWVTQGRDALVFKNEKDSTASDVNVKVTP